MLQQQHFMAAVLLGTLIGICSDLNNAQINTSSNYFFEAHDRYIFNYNKKEDTKLQQGGTRGTKNKLGKSLGG
jgi:hypothetical protein